MNSPDTLLIDADIFLYRAMRPIEREFHLGDDLWVRYADLKEAKNLLEDTLYELEEHTGLPLMSGVFAVSDETSNFRKLLTPTYKYNRQDIRKPIGYPALREYLRETYPCVTYPHLEGDDVMGILGTKDPGKYLLVSDDKDLKQISGWHWKHDSPVWIDQDAADKFFYHQILSGDPADGYSGCPGIGGDTADKMLSKMMGTETYTHVLKSGPRKGMSVLRTRNVPKDTMWEVVVSAYQANNKSYEDALLTARLARILRDGEYDFVSNQPILWSPNNV